MFDKNKINVSGGNNDFVNYIMYNQYFNDLDCYQLTADVVVKQISNNGIGIGMNVFNGSNQNDFVRINLNANALQYYSSNTLISTLTSIGTISVNDTIRIVLSNYKGKLTVSAQNITTNSILSSYTATFTMAYPFSSSCSPCSTRICFFAFAGNYDITSYTLSSTEQTNITTLCIGDSKTYGSGSGGYTARYYGSANSSLQNLIAGSGGPGDTTAELVSRLNQIIAYKPTNVIIWIGCNDLRFGVAAGTWHTNYLNVVNTLKTAGITVYNLYSAPETTQDVTSINTWIAANCTNNIDVYTPLKGAGTSLSATYDCGDGVHPNAAGYALIYSTIKAAYSSII